MNRKARAVWQGTGKDGTGHLTADSGVLSNTPYSFKTRFENEPGTNPEELIAAAHAGCFTMALAFQLQGAGFTPTELATEAAVSLEKEGQGFKISKSALTLRAQGNYPPPHRNVFLPLNQQVTPVSRRCRVESNYRRDASRAASCEAILVVSSGALLS